MTVLNFNAATVQPSHSHRPSPATGPDAFASYIRQHLGYAPDVGKMAHGTLVRFPTSDRRGDENGWCKLFDDGEGGVFGCWRQGTSETWQARQAATPEERAAFRQKVERAREEAERKREQERAECRKRSAELWDKAQPANRQHPYLQLKEVDAHGLRILDNALLVPVRDTSETLHGLQFISPDGSKKFKTGTAVAGCFHVIGAMQDNTLLIAEGYATGATLHEITGHAVACAFNAGNLKPVAKALREMLPDTTLILCADDDHATEGNPGLTKAREAAEAVNGLLAVPAFPPTRGTKDTDFNDLAKLAGPEAVATCLSESRGASSKPTLFMSASELLHSHVNPAYMVKKLIEAATVGLFFGPSGGGKTFNVMELGLSVATGKDWIGRATRQGLVIYLAGEGYKALIRRIKAWCKRNGCTPDDLILFQISRRLTDLTDTATIIDEISTIAERGGAAPSLVIIDTLARHMPDGGDENSTRDMNKLIKTVDALREGLGGCVALFVHHTGHSETSTGRARGSSALKAAMDFEIQCDKGLLTFTKMKDGETPDPVGFKLVPVEIGTDEEGAPITSCIVEYGERSERHQSQKYTRTEREAISALIKASSGPSMVEDGSKYGALIGDWRQAFYDLKRGKDPDVKLPTIKKAFDRATETLEEKGAVLESGHMRLLISDDHQAEIRAAISAEAMLKKTQKGQGTK